MKVKRLKEALERLPDDAEVIVYSAYDDNQWLTNNVTIDTNMRNGEITLCIVTRAAEAGNLRDYEPHPAFEDINKWLNIEELR